MPPSISRRPSYPPARVRDTSEMSSIGGTPSVIGGDVSGGGKVQAAAPKIRPGTLSVSSAAPIASTSSAPFGLPPLAGATLTTGKDMMERGRRTHLPDQQPRTQTQSKIRGGGSLSSNSMVPRGERRARTPTPTPTPTPSSMSPSRSAENATENGAVVTAEDGNVADIDSSSPAAGSSSVDNVGGLANMGMMMGGMYGGGYGGFGGYGGYGMMSPYGMGGYGMYGGGGGPLSSLNNFLFGFQTVVFSLGQAMQILGMNTHALQQLFQTAVSMMDSALAALNEMRALDSTRPDGELSEEELKRRRRLRAMRWSVTVAASYASYRAVRGWFERRRGRGMPGRAVGAGSAHGERDIGGQYLASYGDAGYGRRRRGWTDYGGGMAGYRSGSGYGYGSSSPYDYGGMGDRYGAFGGQY